MKYLLGIDVGTSACKVAIFTLDGKVVSSSASNYKVYYPKPSYVEQDPREWWGSVCIAIKECLSNSNVEASQIAGIGIDGQSWSAIPIDKEGNVLHNTPIWMDTRAKDICERTVDKIGADRILSISGNPFEATYSTPKILWFKENKKEVYKNTHMFLQSNSYIAYKLTGEITQDKSQGYGLHVYDNSKNTYDSKLADDMGIDLGKLPPIYNCHDVVGVVTKKAALETGLKINTPVVAGGLDAACGTLGTGVYKNGQTQEQGGQAGGMSICTDNPVAHEKLIMSNHVVEGKWLLQGGTVGGGGTLEWFKRELGTFEQIEGKAHGKSPFQIMSTEASTIDIGSNGLIFLPYMSGERSPIWDQNAKGTFFGLSYDKTRAHIIRSIMEGVAFSLMHNVTTAYETGATITEFNAMGGSANSLVWTQIKSDVTGKPINVASSDTATTWGAAILAGIGCGAIKDFDSAVKDSVKIKRRHEPNMKNHDIYMKYFDIYLELYQKLKGTMDKLSNI